MHIIQIDLDALVDMLDAVFHISTLLFGNNTVIKISLGEELVNVFKTKAAGFREEEVL